MSNKNPSPTTRFPVNRQNHTKKGPYFEPMLRKLLSADWPIKDVKLKKLCENLKLKQTIAVALTLRRILNAAEGDDLAIERIFDRIDGKVEYKTPLIDQSTHTHFTKIDSKVLDGKSRQELIDIIFNRRQSVNIGKD
jgi:hypothetical protein